LKHITQAKAVITVAEAASDTTRIISVGLIFAPATAAHTGVYAATEKLSE